MQISAGMVANGAACVVLAGVFAVAVVMADVLGFAGLAMIGGITWLACIRASLANDAPTWSKHAFETQMTRDRSPEQRAARQAERQVALDPLRFFGRCGMALTIIGILGFVWQYGWRAPPP